MSNPHGNHRLVFNPQNDNISANERKAISTLRRNSEINLKKADKGTTTIIMDTTQKIQEGSQQLSDDKFYKPLASPIVQETSRKVNAIVSKLFCSGHIDKMTHKWLTTDLKQPRIPEFYEVKDQLQDKRIIISCHLIEVEN